MHINAEGFFVNTAKDTVTGIHASKKKNRWQYRMGGKSGKLVASGMEPAEFVKQFWFRDDFTTST